MSKTLSNGTLSLRFMQNAHRAKQQAQVELEQAKIKDEAEWEVPREVKEAWGIASSSSDSRAETVATHEASYVPFMFSTEPSVSDTGSARPRGRRTFDAKGLEVKEEPVEAKVAIEAQASQKDNSPAKRLTSISGFKPPLPVKKKDSSKTKTKTVQELIREDTRPSSLSHLSRSIDDEPTTAGFVKPVGVDAPTASRAKATLPSTSLKRERDSAAGDASTTKKRKKKKEVQLID